VDNAMAQTSNGNILIGIGNKCLDVNGSNTANGAKVTLWDCHSGPNQKWKITNNGELRGLGNKCLDVNGSNTDNGAKITLWDCHGGPNQKWKLTRSGELRGLGDKCLDVNGSNTANGTPVILYSCTGNPNQKWRFPANKPKTNTTPANKVVNFSIVNATNYPANLYFLRDGERLYKAFNGKGSHTQRSAIGNNWRVRVKGVIIGTYTVRNPNQTLTISAETANAGPIFNQAEADQKCPQVARDRGMVWVGGWWTTVPNKMSVCELAKLGVR
jgi:hypothetical protein